MNTILPSFSHTLYVIHQDTVLALPSKYIQLLFGLLALLETLIQTRTPIILSSCPSQLPALPLGSLEWTLVRLIFLNQT